MSSDGLGARIEFAALGSRTPTRPRWSSSPSPVPAGGARPAVRRCPPVPEEVGCGDRLGSAEPGAPRLEISRMRRRHLRGVMAIERQVYRAPLEPEPVRGGDVRAEQPRYLVARHRRDVVGYAGHDLLRRRGPRHEHRGRPAAPAPRDRHAAARTSRSSQRHRDGRARRSRSRSASRTGGAQRALRPVRVPPGGIRRNYYQELNEDALIMWTDDVRTRAYRRRLDAHRPGAARGRPPGGGTP